MNNGTNTESEVGIDKALRKFSKRLIELGYLKARPWVEVIHSLFDDFKSEQKSKEAKIYGELMQVETLVKEGASSPEILSKIHNAKRVLNGATLCLFLVFLNIAQFSFNGIRCSRVAGGNQTCFVRSVRKREWYYAG